MIRTASLPTASLDIVDSSAIYVNASTHFTNGVQLGLGAEVAVSTQRLHARGPMALRDLTTDNMTTLRITRFDADGIEVETISKSVVQSTCCGGSSARN